MNNKFQIGGLVYSSNDNFGIVVNIDKSNNHIDIKWIKFSRGYIMNKDGTVSFSLTWANKNWKKIS